MRVSHPDRSGGISARPIHELDPDTPRPADLDVTTGGRLSDATDVELYGESDRGEEMCLELLRVCRSPRPGRDRKPGLSQTSRGWRKSHDRPAAYWLKQPQAVSRAPG